MGAVKPGTRPTKRLRTARTASAESEVRPGTQAPDTTPVTSQNRGSRAGSTIHSLPAESEWRHAGWVVWGDGLISSSSVRYQQDCRQRAAPSVSATDRCLVHGLSSRRAPLRFPVALALGLARPDVRRSRRRIAAAPLTGHPNRALLLVRYRMQITWQEMTAAVIRSAGLAPSARSLNQTVLFSAPPDRGGPAVKPGPAGPTTPSSSGSRLTRSGWRLYRILCLAIEWPGARGGRRSHAGRSDAP